MPSRTIPTNLIDASPCPMASQARHNLGAPNESISSRSVVLDRGGEGFALRRALASQARHDSVAA
jgi:hypothetical protein